MVALWKTGPNKKNDMRTRSVLWFLPYLGGLLLIKSIVLESVHTISYFKLPIYSSSYIVSYTVQKSLLASYIILAIHYSACCKYI